MKIARWMIMAAVFTLEAIQEWFMNVLSSLNLLHLFVHLARSMVQATCHQLFTPFIIGYWLLNASRTPSSLTSLSPLQLLSLHLTAKNYLMAANFKFSTKVQLKSIRNQNFFLEKPLIKSFSINFYKNLKSF